MKDPYLYPHTDVIRNLAGIKDRDKLVQLETDFTNIRLAELAEETFVKEKAGISGTDSS